MQNIFNLNIDFSRQLFPHKSIKIHSNFPLTEHKNQHHPRHMPSGPRLRQTLRALQLARHFVDARVQCLRHQDVECAYDAQRNDVVDEGFGHHVVLGVGGVGVVGRAEEYGVVVADGRLLQVGGYGVRHCKDGRQDPDEDCADDCHWFCLKEIYETHFCTAQDTKIENY